MKRAYQITSIVFILFSALIAREAIDLQYYTSLGPGPGFFPFWLSVFLGLLAALMLFHATFKPQEALPKDFFPTKSGSLRMLAIAGAIIGTIVLFDLVGFRLTMLAFYLFLLFALGRQNLIVTGVISILGSWGVFYLFDSLLKVPLPQGMFGF